MDNKEPDRFYIRKSDAKDYKDLNEEKESQLYGKDNKYLFILAMCIAFHEEVPRTPLDIKKDYFRVEYLTDKELSIIKAIAIAEEGNLEVLLDKKKVYIIAEEYAASGIKLLKERVMSGGYGSFSKKLESELMDEFIKIKKNEL